MDRFLSIEIDLRALDALGKGLRQYRRMVVREFERAMTRTVLSIEKEAKRRCPVDTGRLRASIASEVEGPTRGRVGTNVEYAAAVEYGTSSHEIRPRRASVLAWKDPRTGRMVFARRVSHPGTRAQPFLEPAYLAGRDDAKRNFERAMKRLLSKLERKLR